MAEVTTPTNIVIDENDRMNILIGAGYAIQVHNDVLTLRFMEKDDVKKRLTFAEASGELNALMAAHNTNLAIATRLRKLVASVLDTDK